MHSQFVACIIIVLLHLGRQLASQVTHSGHTYQLVSGQDADDTASPFDKYAAYIECGQDNSCGYVAKEKSGGKFIIKKNGEKLNAARYTTVWKKINNGKNYDS